MLSLLNEYGILGAQVYPSWLDEMLIECEPCRARKAKNCVGWILDIPPDSPLKLAVTLYSDRLVQLDVSVRATFKRAQPGRAEDWEARPVAATSIALNIFLDDDPEKPAERHHIDFAEPGQPGTLWHLQTGGNPSGYPKFATSFLKVPRWPTAPVDLALVLEVIVMNFYEDEWMRLCRDGRWNNLLQASEDLMLTEYSRHLTTYLTRARAGQRDGSWMTMQSDHEWPVRSV